jgi:hypothetical protein
MNSRLSYWSIAELKPPYGAHYLSKQTIQEALTYVSTVKKNVPVFKESVFF